MYYHQLVHIIVYQLVVIRGYEKYVHGMDNLKLGKMVLE